MKTLASIKPVDPYRLLFPVGFVLAVWGSLLWVLFYSNVNLPYPGLIHAAIMMLGFQFVVATGFLMTAVPRFTGTKSAGVGELGGALFIVITLAVVSVPVALGALPEKVFFWVGLAVALYLLGFFLKRFLRRAHSPPPSFFFVGAGMLCAVLGSLFTALTYSGFTDAIWLMLGRAFLFHGMMLGLVLGVGSRLITANLGWMQNPIVTLAMSGRAKPSILSWWKSAHGSAAAMSVIFLSSFPIEVFVSVPAGRWLRTLVATYVILTGWKIYHLPKARTRNAWWLWISSWFILIGLWLYAALPAYALHSAHLIFVGGFSLMIFFIAARVTLSHGGHDLSFEQKSPVYPWMGALAVAAALIRFSAAFVQDGSTYSGLIVLASVVFLFLLAIWGATFMRLLLPKFGRGHAAGSA